jgi:hypothetical protein
LADTGFKYASRLIPHSSIGLIITEPLIGAKNRGLYRFLHRTSNRRQIEPRGHTKILIPFAFTRFPSNYRNNFHSERSRIARMIVLMQLAKMAIVKVPPATPVKNAATAAMHTA